MILVIVKSNKLLEISADGTSPARTLRNQACLFICLSNVCGYSQQRDNLQVFLGLLCQILEVIITSIFLC